MPHIYLLQTKNFPLFWNHKWKYNIQAKEKVMNHWILCFCSFFYFLHSTASDNKCHKQKWYMLFFTCIKIVVHVLACTNAIAHFQWRRLSLCQRGKEILWLILMWKFKSIMLKWKLSFSVHLLAQVKPTVEYLHYRSILHPRNILRIALKALTVLFSWFLIFKQGQSQFWKVPNFFLPNFHNSYGK